MTWECWAYIAPHGYIIADSGFDTPDSAWQVGLGWPDESEIEDARCKGARMVRVRITEIEEGKA